MYTLCGYGQKELMQSVIIFGGGTNENSMLYENNEIPLAFGV